MKHKKKLIAAAVAVLALAAGIVFNASSASAADVAVVQPGPNTVGTNQLINSGVWGTDIHDNTIAWPKLGWDLRQHILATDVSLPDSVNSSNQIAIGTVAESDLATSVQAKLNAGPTNVTKSCASVALAHTGGPFKTLKTKVCEFNLPAGTWMVNTSAFFSRTAAGADGVRPQMAVRVGASETEYGIDYGTILGTEISAAASREMTGSATKVVTVAPGGVTVEVFGHGYQDNVGDTDGGKISAAADIVAVKIAG